MAIRDSFSRWTCGLIRSVSSEIGSRSVEKEPGAFGDPLKTNALNETAASAKKRAAQAAQAAKEKAKREAEEEAAAKAKQEAIETLRCNRHAREAAALGLTEEQYATLRKTVLEILTKGVRERVSMTLGTIPQAMASQIKALLNIDVSTFHISVANAELRHTRKRHGKHGKGIGERKKDQTPLRPSDILSAPLALNNPDFIDEGSRNERTGARSVRAYKTDNRGTLIAVFCIDNQGHKLDFTTAWRKKKRLERPGS